jgi:hypothetical protein
MHGDVSDISKVVLTKHDYEDYYLTRELFSNAFKADFVSRTMLFIGFSFTDPNLDYLISRIRTIQHENKKPDYYFIKEESDNKKFHRQKIRANSLLQYGLNPIWISDYDEIPEILKVVERRVLRNSIMIAGSAHTYGKYWEENDRAHFLIHELSKKLSRQEFVIVSGFGLGVGSGVINGVLDNMRESHSQNIGQYLVLRPFPQHRSPAKTLTQLWKEYREEFIPLAGICIFIFGNKLENQELVSAEGLKEEFNMAVANGLKVIPIGSTGFVSEELYNFVIQNFDTYYPEHPELIEDFKILGRKEADPQQILASVLKIVTILNK